VGERFAGEDRCAPGLHHEAADGRIVRLQGRGAAGDDPGSGKIAENIDPAAGLADQLGPG
jgi:hypothetical protein